MLLPGAEAATAVDWDATLPTFLRIAIPDASSPEHARAVDTPVGSVPKRPPTTLAIASAHGRLMSRVWRRRSRSCHYRAEAATAVDWDATLPTFLRIAIPGGLITGTCARRRYTGRVDSQTTADRVCDCIGAWTFDTGRLPPHAFCRSRSCHHGARRPQRRSIGMRPYHPHFCASPCRDASSPEHARAADTPVGSVPKRPPTTSAIALAQGRLMSRT
jgi:hypothetical protein